MLRSLPLFSLPLLLLAGPGLAQDAPNLTDAQHAAIADFAILQETRQEVFAAEREARQKVQEAQGSEEAVAEYTRVRDSGRARIEVTEQAFLASFSKVNWQSWNPAGTATVETESGEPQDVNFSSVLGEGLMLTGTKALDAHDDAAAVKAFEYHLEALPEGAANGMIATYYLPQALMGAGDLKAAVASMEKLVESVDEEQKPAALVNLGDALAASGDVQAARAVYTRAADSVESGVNQRDPRARAKSDADFRLALVGKQAPDIDSSTWSGGEAQSLSSLVGNVVMLDFWATWCGPCRDVMPAIDDEYRESAPRGLKVLGVTRFYPSGFLPESRDAMHSGERVSGITEASYGEHLQAFRDATGISYPFVIASESDFTNYKVRGIPTLVVVDRAGAVRFVTVGSGSHAFVEQAVEVCLEEGVTPNR